MNISLLDVFSKIILIMYKLKKVSKYFFHWNTSIFKIYVKR